jgi:Zn-dependent peptidase ImmA (M78 family)/transcriptional regulator with XRE-family HTH domain
MAGISLTALVMARESRRFTQGQLAAAAGLAQGTISKLENGLIAADEAMIAKMAEALGYPREFFTSDVTDPELPVVYYKKRKSLVRASDEKVIRAKVNIIRRGVARLLQSVETPPWRLPGIDLAHVSGTPASIAKDLRAQWGLPRGPIDNVTTLLERAGVVVVPFDFGTSAMDGLSLHRPDDGIPPMIFIRTDCPGDRQRFVLMHELAHVIFHHHLPIVPEVDDFEREADEFAAEMVAPATDIRPYLVNPTLEKLGGLKRHWRLPILCLLKRAEDLGRISGWKAKQLWMATSKLGYRKCEPIAVAAEEPTLLPKVLRVHVEELGYTEAEVARAMQGDPSALRPRQHQLRAVK